MRETFEGGGEAQTGRGGAVTGEIDASTPAGYCDRNPDHCGEGVNPRCVSKNMVWRDIAIAGSAGFRWCFGVEIACSYS